MESYLVPCKGVLFSFVTCNIKENYYNGFYVRQHSAGIEIFEVLYFLFFLSSIGPREFSISELIFTGCFSSMVQWRSSCLSTVETRLS